MAFGGSLRATIDEPRFSDARDKNFEFPFAGDSVDTQVTLGRTMWALWPELEFSARIQAGYLVC
jgi:hypothetical protein